MNASTAAMVVALLALAGCLGGDSPGPVPSSTSSSTSPSSSTTSSTTPPAPSPAAPPVLDLLLGFEMADCHGLTLQHAQPLDDIQALLPPGFNATPAPGSADPRGLVTVALYSCGSFSVGGAVVPQTFFGFVSTAIARPEQRVPGAPDAAIQEYLFRVLAGPDVLGVLWPAAGYDTYAGNASANVTGAGLPIDSGARSGTGQVGSGYTLAATGTLVPGLPLGVAGPFARYTALADGSVLVWTGHYDLGNAAFGQGIATLAGDDPVASLGVGLPDQAILQASALLHDAGAIRAQDLRRVFTPAA